MNLTKARDFYSEYREGTLDGGLRQAFERALQSDPHIQADYDEFCATMASLDSMKDATIEVPFGLQDAISAQLDKHIFESERVKKTSSIFNWRLPLYGAVAATAIFGTLVALNQDKDGGPFEASLTPIRRNEEARPVLSVKDGKVDITYRTGESQTATVKDIKTGAVLHEIKVGKTEVSTPISNERVEPVTVVIEFSGNIEPIHLVIPGTGKSDAVKGEGTLADLAVFIADRYRVPVLLPAESASKLSWSVEPGVPVEELPGVLAPFKVLVETRSNGFLALSL